MTAYSLDFRRKMIEAYEKGNTSIREVAKRFSVSPDTVRRLLKQYRETGDLTPQKCGSKQKSVLSGYKEMVLKMVEEQSDLTLWQYCEQFREQTGVSVSTSMMDRFFREHNITLKKKIYRSAKVVTAESLIEIIEIALTFVEPELLNNWFTKCYYCT